MNELIDFNEALNGYLDIENFEQNMWGYNQYLSEAVERECDKCEGKGFLRILISGIWSFSSNPPICPKCKGLGKIKVQRFWDYVIKK